MDQMQADGIAPWTLPCSELNCKKRDKKKKKNCSEKMWQKETKEPVHRHFSPNIMKQK